MCVGFYSERLPVGLLSSKSSHGLVFPDSLGSYSRLQVLFRFDRSSPRVFWCELSGGLGVRMVRLAVSWGSVHGSGEGSVGFRSLYLETF